MAMILDAFVSAFMDLLVDLVEDEVAMLLGVPKEIKKLQSTLGKINNVLADAERRRVEDRAVNDWLKELKDIMYDADDILDDCRIEAERHSATSSKTQKQTVCCPFPLFSCFRNPKFAHDIGKRINSLNRRLEEISNEKEKFRFNLNLPFHDERGVSWISDKTSPVMESDIVGTKIEEDTKSLVELLTKEDTRENLLVFAIVGIGGIGKTTLAQKIFDDEKTKDDFQLKMWLCVSQEFTEVTLLGDLISSAGGSYGGTPSRSLLEPMLVDLVRGRRFLLVLDDVWTERVWNNLLKNPLRSGALGSRVLVTSRNEGVVKQMKAVHIHHVELLSSEDGWSLLCKKVFLEGEEVVDDLKDLGMAIVEKCDGLPLAIKTIGGVLCQEKRTRSCWDAVLRSTAWSVSGLPEEVNKALYLSYVHLPSHLKQCFIYCSLFPQDHEIVRRHLVELWIAEGFVKAEGTLSTEEIGERYYRELISKNLLLPIPEYHDLEACRMHGLLRSLAQFLARDESLFLGEGQQVSGSSGFMKLRRLAMVGGEMMEGPHMFRIKESLRTLLLFKNQWNHLNGLCDRFWQLRVLNLRGTGVRELPDSLVNLVHLRYLGLINTLLTTLPENIRNLRNLLFLDLQYSRNLHHLPNSIVDLHNLRMLHLHQTAIDGLPIGLGRLQHLNTLFGFQLHEDTEGGWCTLEELQHLSQLRELRIDNLERVSDCNNARVAALSDKPHLVLLELYCRPQWVDEATEDDVRRVEEVFEELRPPPCLEFFGIRGYPGRMFPHWMTAKASPSTLILSNLIRLELTDWAYCEKLPPLGKLVNLDYLWIEIAPRVKNVGHEFLGLNGDEGAMEVQSSTFTSFPKLKTLGFEGMTSWEEWHWQREARSMPCLEILHINGCLKLGSLPEGLIPHATALRQVILIHAENFRLVGNLVWLEKLDIIDCPNLTSVSNFPALKRLEVGSCPGLKVVENVPLLRRIKLTDYEMNSLPEWLSDGVSLAKPEKLEIHCDVELIKMICLKEQGQEWSKIQHIGRVSLYSKYRWVHATYTKNPYSFTTNLNKEAESHFDGDL